METDRLEVERLAAQEGAHRCGCPRLACALANVRRRERCSGGSAEQELVTIAPGRGLVRERVAAQLAGDRDDALALLALGRDRPQVGLGGRLAERYGGAAIVEGTSLRRMEPEHLIPP